MEHGTLHSSFWNITFLKWNITISILKYEKKNASRLLYILQRYKLPKMGLLHNLGHWFIFNDSFLRRNKTNYERFIAYIQIDAHLMFLTSFKMNFYTYFPLIPLFKIFSNRPVCILPLMLSGA